ncbi:tripartite motif-containing protein 30A-like isoform X4 [Mus musculus]|uniref:tripartite motif-containing protein 30A-like isoform X4 n=1 Tax=Mus musculus TaxID=10090 RepID=UPI00167BB75F|nr:tripartite motif-containing protein 30A-like isoform X4 [Mus musculus]
MASSILEMIKDEVTCPICLELLKEPVSTDCDHSFCRACITLNYESSKSRGTEEGSCPVCRVRVPFGNLRTNRQMANIVERLKGFKSIPEGEQKVNVCAQHGEKLQLFCKKDMMAICWVCERSQEHHGHQTALIEEVDHEYKEKLQTALQKLMENEKRCDEWQDDLQQQRADWENVNNVLRRSQTLRLKQPQMIPKKTYQPPDLNSMLQSFQGLMMSSDTGVRRNHSTMKPSPLNVFQSLFLC